MHGKQTESVANRRSRQLCWANDENLHLPSCRRKGQAHVLLERFSESRTVAARIGKAKRIYVVRFLGQLAQFRKAFEKNVGLTPQAQTL